MKKCFCLLILSISLMNLTNSVNATENNITKEEFCSEYIPEEATAEAKECLADLGTLIKGKLLALPYTCILADDDEAIYYYPVIQSGKITTEICVSGYINSKNQTLEYSAGTDSEYADFLNDIDYVNDTSYLFFMDESFTLYAINEDNECYYRNDAEEQTESLDGYTYEEVMVETIDYVKNSKPFDITKFPDNPKDAIVDDTCGQTSLSAEDALFKYSIIAGIILVTGGILLYKIKAKK